MAILGRAGCWPLWSAIPILRRSILNATEHLLQGQASATPQTSSICVTASTRFVLSNAGIACQDPDPRKRPGADLWSGLWGRSSRLLTGWQCEVKATIIVGLDIQVLVHRVTDFELHRHRKSLAL